MNYFNWAMIGTSATMIWGYFSGFASRIRSLFIVNIVLECEAQEAFMFLLWKEFTRSKFGDRLYRGTVENVIPENRVLKIGYEAVPKQKLIFWKGWKPILIGAVGYNNSPDTKAATITVNYLKWTFDFETLLIRAFDLINNQEVETSNIKRFSITKVFGKDRSYNIQTISPSSGNTVSPIKEKENLKAHRILKWTHEEIGAFSTPDPFASYSFPKEVDGFINNLERWKASKAWFLEKRIAWRYGALLYGKPGSGKSSLVRCLAQQLDFPIFVYDLSSLTNVQLNDKWQDMLSVSPCIALFEDIDSVFNGRENVKSKEGVTFDCLLNLISGVESSNGLITIVTTNDLSKIDPALGIPNKEGKSSRPGRLDCMIELSLMNAKCRRSLAKKILSDCPENVDYLVKLSEGFTAAQTQELFAQVALKHYWSNKC